MLTQEQHAKSAQYILDIHLLFLCWANKLIILFKPKVAYLIFLAPRQIDS